MAKTGIRLAEPSDVPQIREVVKRAYEGYTSLIGKPPAPMLDDYAALVRDGSVSVIESGGQVVALIVLVMQSDHLFIDNVAVDPDFQGKGYGRNLLAAAEAAARCHRLFELRLYTNVVMTENLSLYAHLGFNETHRAEQDGFQRVFMTKRLRPL